MKQLERLIDVIKLRDMTYDDAVKESWLLDKNQDHDL